MLTTAQQKFLRSHAHHLSPVVWVGASGVTEALLNELSLTLDTHELIKVKLLNDDRDQRQQMIEQLLSASGAEKVQSIGKIVVLYRANAKQPKMSLPR
jgi:RNA-binding protein